MIEVMTTRVDTSQPNLGHSSTVSRQGVDYHSINAAGAAVDSRSAQVVRDELLFGLDSEDLTATLAARTAATPATTTVGTMSDNATVTAASYTPASTQAGATATKRTYTLTNTGSDGNATTAIAVFDGVTGQDLTAAIAKALTLSGTLNVSANDIIKMVETVTSTGTANPGGTLLVTLVRR